MQVCLVILLQVCRYGTFVIPAKAGFQGSKGCTQCTIIAPPSMLMDWPCIQDAASVHR